MNLSTNSNSAPPSLTAEAFKQTVAGILKEYSGPMLVQPDWFQHVTPCCERVYSTLGPCADHCPYHCGKPWKNSRLCPACQALSDALRIG